MKRYGAVIFQLLLALCAACLIAAAIVRYCELSGALYDRSGMSKASVWPTVSYYLQIKLRLFDVFTQAYPILFAAYTFLFFRSIRWQSWINLILGGLFILAACLWANVLGLTDWFIG